jgi:hypothetical protein
MSVEVVVAGRPDPAEVAAITAAVAAILEEEQAAAVHDPLPAAYRSAWREAAIAEGLRPAARIPIRR